MITAFVGGLYALMEHNIHACWLTTPWKISALSCWGWARRNGYRARTTGTDCSWPGRWLYHLLNHSLFKSVLFLGAGRSGSVPVIAISKNSVVLARKSGYLHRHVSRVDGNGCAAATNGFAGEWVIYQSFFKLSNSGRLLPVCWGRCSLWVWQLPVPGGDVYGESLWRHVPRRAAYKEAENATCAPLLMSVSVVALRFAA